MFQNALILFGLGCWLPFVQGALAEQGTPSVALEIFPVVLSEGKFMYVKPLNRSSWVVHCLSAPHPNDQVLSAMEKFRTRPQVVHSTSWRFRDSGLVLTYLVVLSKLAELPEGFEARLAPKAQLARGTALQPPATIEVEAVLTHALRHLAWLSQDDSAVRKELPVGWAKALRPFRPGPFSQIPQGAQDVR